MKNPVIIFVAIVIILITAAAFVALTPQGKVTRTNIGIDIPSCPNNLSGILTYPLMDPRYIAALTPLGNINPPGHTSPVDHIYFQTTYDGKIPMGAPADATITKITTISKERTPGKYIVEGYEIKFLVCKGLELDFASYNDLVEPIKSAIERMGENDCKRDIVKGGHGGIAEGQCYYNVSIPVKSGEPVGWIWQVPHPENGEPTLPFEIWAANYNIDPPSQTDWKYYNDNRYAHIMCPFDLYAEDLKKQFEAKFGRWEYEAREENGKKIINKETAGRFVARNGEPLCGTVDQDVTGTIQGMWFSKPTPEDDYNAKFDGGLAFLHDNIDVTMGEVSIGGDLANGRAGVIFFKPTHSGTIDREPSEVKADGKIYCYRTENTNNFGNENEYKFLVQLMDDRHIRAEIRAGACGQVETFQNPFFYER